MRRTLILIVLALAALASLAGAPLASAADARRPTITKVSPMRLSVGAQVTIRGRNFRSRPSRNTVIFRAPSGRSAFVKPRSATRRKLVVVVSPSVGRLLTTSATRMRLRVLAGTFSKWTPRRLSPVIVGKVPASAPGAPGVPAPAPGTQPGGSGTPVTPPPPPPPPDCDGDGALNSVDTDDDNDLLLDTLEAAIKTDACLKDTDKDGVEDGFEYRSAVDLNNDDYQEPNESLPYPGKRPYPNALDPSDGNTDYDGDTLTQAAEQKLWKYSTTPATRTLSPLTYSDGLQYSVYTHQAGQGDRRFPALAAAGYSKQADFNSWATAEGYRTGIFVRGSMVRDLYDLNLDGTETAAEALVYDRDADGWLSDEERDEDADALTNYDEFSGRMLPTWWAKCYGGEGTKETPYYVKYAGTDVDDPDSDGDGVRDGADDQDHDDLPNVMELSRIRASGLDDRENGQECKVDTDLLESFSEVTPPWSHHPSAYGQVNPFNPCLPFTDSRTCNNYPAFDDAWAPFDDSPDWFSLN